METARGNRWIAFALLALVAHAPGGAWAQEEPAARPPEGRDRSEGGRFRGGRGPRGGAMDLFGLLRDERVRKAVNVTEEEEAYLGILAEEFRDQDRAFFEKMRDLSDEERRDQFRERMEKRNAETDEKIGEIMGAERLKRLKQIQFQAAGPMALFSPRVADQLQLTEAQRDQIRGQMRSGGERMREIFSGTNDPEERRAAFRDFRKEQEAQMLALLTAEQKKKWQEMKGEPVGFEFEPPGFGGPPPGGRRGPPPGPPEKRAAEET